MTLRRSEAWTLKPCKELASILLEKLGIPENGEQVWKNDADGVWLVELARIFDSLLVQRTIHLAVGLHDEPPRPGIDMLTEYPREKQLLIILDTKSIYWTLAHKYLICC